MNEEDKAIAGLIDLAIIAGVQQEAVIYGATLVAFPNVGRLEQLYFLRGYMAGFLQGNLNKDEPSPWDLGDPYLPVPSNSSY